MTPSTFVKSNIITKIYLRNKSRIAQRWKLSILTSYLGMKIFEQYWSFRHAKLLNWINSNWRKWQDYGEYWRQIARSDPSKRIESQRLLSTYEIMIWTFSHRRQVRLQMAQSQEQFMLLDLRDGHSTMKTIQDLHGSACTFKGCGHVCPLYGHPAHELPAFHFQEYLGFSLESRTAPSFQQRRRALRLLKLWLQRNNPQSLWLSLVSGVRYYFAFSLCNINCMIRADPCNTHLTDLNAGPSARYLPRYGSCRPYDDDCVGSNYKQGQLIGWFIIYFKVVLLLDTAALQRQAT